MLFEVSLSVPAGTLVIGVKLCPRRDNGLEFGPITIKVDNQTCTAGYQGSAATCTSYDTMAWIKCDEPVAGSSVTIYSSARAPGFFSISGVDVIGQVSGFLQQGF